MSLLINKHIYAALTSNKEITKRVGDRLYPIAAHTDVKFPFIVYARDEIKPNSTKDGECGDTTIASIIISTEKYSESIELAQLVRKSLTNKRVKYPEFSVEECVMIDAEENHSDGYFVQLLTFQFQTEE